MPPRPIHQERSDPVTPLVAHARQLLKRSPGQSDITALLGDLQDLSPRDLVRFDARCRSSSSGLDHRAIAQLRKPSRRGPHQPQLWEALGLMSGDGREREQACATATCSALTVRLLALRGTDWAEPVRTAALNRLAGCPASLLIEALPLVEQLTRERIRSQGLCDLLEARISDEDLRAATCADDRRIQRAAWLRLGDRGVAQADELRTRAARHHDVAVRGVAARALDRLPADDRRNLAAILVDDATSWIATTALSALVVLDGDPVIRRALQARRPALRRAARGWATVREIDVRAVCHARLGDDPSDAIALVTLAEIADARDIDLLRTSLADARARVRTAALRGLARVDPAAGRATAIQALASGATGRVMWAAVDVLRGPVPAGAEAEYLTCLALDADRNLGLRIRVLALLRPLRWVHLAVALQARDAAVNVDGRAQFDRVVDTWLAASRHISHAPTPALRTAIEAHLPSLDGQTRTQIEFVLRTSSLHR